MSRPRKKPLPVDDLSKQRLRVWLRILKLSRTIESDLRERLRVTFDSTMPRFDVLAALYRNQKGMKMSELSAALMVSNGNVTGIIERLVSDGFVVRVPVAGDRRAMLVRLTGRGRDEFAAMAEIHESWVDEILADLDEAGAAALLGRLDDIAITGRQAR